MRRAYYIFTALYFPLLVTLILQFYPDVSPDIFESDRVKILSFLWLGDGLAVLALSLALLKQQLSLPRGGRSTAIVAACALTAPLGVIPAYLVLDLALKFYKMMFS